jgi:hypothetical protein
MTKKHRIPLLRGHHSHPFFYASVSDGIDLKRVRAKQDALALMKRSRREITVVQEWNDGLYKFSPQELDSLSPTVVCNLSLHRFLVNKPGREKLGHNHGDLIAHIDDTDWVERNLPGIPKFVANISPCNAERLKKFYDEDLLAAGVWYAEDLLLCDESVICIVILATPIEHDSGRIRKFFGRWTRRQETRFGA